MLLLLFISDSLKCFIRYSESEEGRIGRWIEWRMRLSGRCEYASMDREEFGTSKSAIMIGVLLELPARLFSIVAVAAIAAAAPWQSTFC